MAKKRRDKRPIIPLVLIALGFLLLVPGCLHYVAQQVSHPLEARTLGLTAPPWASGDYVEYRVTDWIGDYLGEATFSFQRDGDAWVIKEDTETARLEKHSILKLKSNSLKPISMDKTISTPGGDLRLVTKYLGDKLQLKTVAAGQASRDEKDDKLWLTLNTPLDAYDNDQLPMTLRALPFAEGYRATYTNIIPATANTPTTVTVGKQERVETPAGTYKAWKVTVDFGPVEHYLWYQVDAPHHLLKYDNGDAIFVLKQTQRASARR